MRGVVLLMLGVWVCLNLPLGAQQVIPVAISLYDPIAFPSATVVKGVRLNLLYGKHDDVAGLDLGLVTHTLYKSTGISVSLLQIGHKASGFRVGAINVVDEASGVQFGAINFNKFLQAPSLGILYNEASLKASGPQVGLWNVAGDMGALQFGILNYATESVGMQVGLINVADTMSSGVQVGLLNISNNGFFPVLKL